MKKVLLVSLFGFLVTSSLASAVWSCDAHNAATSQDESASAASASPSSASATAFAAAEESRAIEFAEVEDLAILGRINIQKANARTKKEDSR